VNARQRAPQVVMMEGVSPGIGKSTLGELLAESLRAQGVAVDLFPEEQLFTRDDFSAVAHGFRTKASPSPEAFLDAYGQTIGRCLANRAWLICDWNCAGMASDLTWALADRALLERLVRDVRLLAADCQATVLYLAGDIEAATRRAARQRGPEWVARMVRIAAEHGIGPGQDIDRIVAYERDGQDLRARDLHALAVGGWQVLRVDAQQRAADVLVQARAALGI
jgi:thymidylate kinase